MSRKSRISYRIDSDDNIVFVNDAWSRTAAENGASELSDEKVLDKNLWDFISDSTTEHLYREIVDWVRLGNKIKFVIRCDAPATKVLLQMKIELKKNAEVGFDCYPISITERKPQKMLYRSTARSEKVLLLCSWCSRVEIGKDDWREVEDALEALQLFRDETMPLLSHGMCKECFGNMSRRLNPQPDHSRS
jgi:hypothetical protein